MPCVRVCGGGEGEGVGEAVWGCVSSSSSTAAARCLDGCAGPLLGTVNYRWHPIWHASRCAAVPVDAGQQQHAFLSARSSSSLL